MLKLAPCLARHSFLSLLLVVYTLSIPTPHGLNQPSPHTTTTTTKTTTTDVLLIPPTITSEPQRLYYCEKEPNERILLKCTATGNPQPIISWRRLGGSLPKEYEDNGRGTLTLVTNDSDGYYQCRAKNIAGTALSNITRLLCLIDVHKKIEQQPAIVVDTAVLHCCQDVELYPVSSLTVKWFMKNNCSTYNSREISITNSQKYHVADKYNNTLVITNLQQNDIQCFRYWCVLSFYTARNKFGMVLYPYTLPQNYNLSGPSGGASNERRLVYRSRPITAVDGDDVTMTCVYSGRTPANVTWSRLSGRPVRGHVTEFGRQLRLQNVRVEDSDDYSCTATDSRDTNNTIQLTVGAKPTIVLALPSVNVTVGENISFSCNYSGTPRPEAQWYINGQPSRGGLSSVSKSAPIIRINEYESSITFAGLISGFVIACNVSNIHDYEMSTAYVAVLPRNYHVTTTSPAIVSGTDSSPASQTDETDDGPLSMALLSVAVPVAVAVLIVLVVVVVGVVVAVFCFKKRRRQPRTEDKKPEKREVAAAAPPPQLDNQSMNSNSRQSLSSSSSISASLASFDSGIDEVANSEDNKINEQLHLMNEHHPRAEDADSDTDDAS